MRAITDLTSAEARGIRGLLFDLDDTFLDEGQLSEAAYSALFRLRSADLFLVAVTGRPALWGELICRQWPITGAVTENGNIAYARLNGRIQKLDPVAQELRLEHAQRLHGLVRKMNDEFPGLDAADDNPARISDHTFDIGEHTVVDGATVARAMAFARLHGAKTQRSSVHLHITFDRHDKASGVLHFLRSVAKQDPTTALAQFAFIGDSENDAACFAAFRTSVAVANLRGRPSIMPRFVTRGARSAGFVELTEQLIRARNG